MDSLKASLTQLAERIDALSVRERGLMFVVVLAVLCLIAFNVVFGPLRAESARLEREIKTRYQEVSAIDQQLAALVSGSEVGGTEGQARIASLTKQIAELDAQMDRMTTGVVSPKEMAKLVEQMLSRNKGLELIKLEALAPVPVDGETKAAAMAAGAADGLMYRHGMQIQFRGRYFDIIEYLKMLEAMQWKVFWGRVSLESDTYPYSRVTLVIYTLSRHPAWIGV